MVAKNVTTATAGHENIDDAIGTSDLSALTTDDKSGLVESINEADTAADLALSKANAIMGLLAFGAQTSPVLANGTTDGKIKTSVGMSYRIALDLFYKAATDNLWDLSAEVDTIAAEYRAYALELDSSGTASFVASSTEASAAAAFAALAAVGATKSRVGIYIAGPSTDFNGVAHLLAQGTYYNGVPQAV